MTTATDVDNNVSTVTEYDALGRPTKVRSAAGTPLESWTRTEYDDVNRRVVVRSDIEAMGDGRKVSIQHFDQLGRVRLARTLEDVQTEDPYNEQHGIKVETRYKTVLGYTYQLTSNPFRANYSMNETDATMGWTLSTAWSHGRRSEVETFAGAALPVVFGGNNTNSTGIVRTDIDANTTTVTDQAGKQRRSVTNALGQLVRVDEPDAAGNLGPVSIPVQPTYYSYDALNNLTQVVQAGSGAEQCGPAGGNCSQTRTFTYNSLSRLVSATNPESGTIHYQYDANGNLTQKTDARGVSTVFTYDALNRATFRNYSDSTPDITYTYDDPQVPFSKGKLTKVSSYVSESLITSFDAKGRVTGSQQKTDGQTYNFSYTYNLDDDLKTQTYPSGKVVEFNYDASGDLSRVGNANGFTYANGFSYAPHGQID